jgi:deoxycytidylate deaminase
MHYFDFSDVPMSDLRDPRHPFHLYHMELALEEAAQARDEDEVPVGAVIVSTDLGIIARAHNQREQLHDPTAHAEMIAFTQAAQALKHWRLLNCILYVTLAQPCRPDYPCWCMVPKIPRLVHVIRYSRSRTMCDLTIE